VIGSRAVRLFPLYHPAAALYTPSMLETLRTDFHRIPGLLALGAPAQPEPIEPFSELEEESVPEPEQMPGAAQPEPAPQLGLF
jgi:uracil-DNA glycosylase